MNRRYISFILGLVVLSCALLSMLSYAYASESEQYGYIEVCVNGNSKNYATLKNKDDLYLKVDDFAEITGYDLEIDDIIAYSKAGNLDTITTVAIEFDGTAYAMGKEYKVNIIENGEDTFLPLNEMLYLLHSQWCMEDGRVMIQPLSYTIIDFLGSSNYEYMWKNKVNQTDLLVNGESELAHNLRSSLAAVFNDFDPMMFILWWPGEGMTPALNEEYEEALLQLAVDDKDFLDSYGQAKIAEDLAQVKLDTIKNDFENMKNVLDIPENLIDGAESVDEVVEWISELSNNKKSLKFNSYGDVSYMTSPRIKAWSREIGNITDALEIANLLINVSEVSQRSQHWGKDFINEIDILTNFDNMGYNTTITNRVKKVASDLIEEYKNPINAASDEAALRSTALFLGKVFDESLFGKYFAIFNAGLAIAKTDENIKNSVDAADLSYMVDCLVKTEQIAMNEMSCSYIKLLGNNVNGDLTEQDVERLRNCTMLSLRTNLRNHTFIYYLNEKLNDDLNWENSMQAQEIREKIVNDYILLCHVMETEPYDKLILLDDFENMYSDEYGMVRQPVTVEAFHEGEIPKEENNIFELIPKKFTFSSGAGGWATEITLNDDGNFNGQYYDFEMGDRGDEYPNGTVYISNFSGKFTIPKQIDEYTYSMRLDYLQEEGNVGDDYYEDGIRYIIAEPYGFDNADEFLIYFPGIDMADLPEGFITWLYAFLDVQAVETLPYYGIYNVDGEAGFVSYSAGMGEEVDLTNIYMEFLESYSYQSYVPDWMYGTPREYAILDINEDGIEELIITGGDGLGFYNFVVFSYDKISNEIYVLPIQGSEVLGENYTGNIAQCYGGIQYSPKYHALVFTELNNGAMFNSYEYFVIDNRKLITDFSLWFEYDYATKQVFYGIADSSKQERIDQTDYDSYISERINLEWSTIPITTSLKSSSKTDLSDYIGMDILSFIEYINDMKDVGATDGSIEYSNGSIIVSAEYGSNSITFISINGDCNYSIQGIEYGMSFETATELAYQFCEYIIDDLPHYKRFVMAGGKSISFHAEDEKTVDSINLFVN